MSGYFDIREEWMSFAERTLWLQVAALVAVYGWFFSAVVPGHGQDIAPDQVVLFVIAAVALAAIMAVGLSILAIVARRDTTPDERDRLYALLGTRNGAFALGVAVFVALVTGVAVAGNFAFLNVLLAGWVVAQLVGVGSTIVLYRRGT